MIKLVELFVMMNLEYVFVENVKKEVVGYVTWRDIAALCNSETLSADDYGEDGRDGLQAKSPFTSRNHPVSSPAPSLRGVVPL